MKKLKALLINGSPRAKGCTYTAFFNQLYADCHKPILEYGLRRSGR